MAKLPGKTKYSGRRRPMTRRSGFHVHDEVSGSAFRRIPVSTNSILPDRPLILNFRLPIPDPGQFMGYGVWYATSVPNIVDVEGGPSRYTMTRYPPPSWNKLGSLWRHGRDGSWTNIRMTIRADHPGAIAVYGQACGIVHHEHLAVARAALLRNMYEYSPEAIFLQAKGTVEIDGYTATPEPPALELLVKACNRCGRYLPFNYPAEHQHLSFTNHCSAEHLRPCHHASFGNLRDVDSGEELALDYGLQLECRFCKKFTVNAPHNRQRTRAQMKEDAARRRGFELLIERMAGGSAQLRYRHETGHELADIIWAKFGGKCFACSHELGERDWHQDHTRPLALLWPLDETATALCGSCNSRKRDRAPAQFYTPEQLAKLSRITGIPLKELNDPTPNMVVINMLIGSRLDWFFDDFLMSPEFQAELDGKRPAELLVKALQKTLNKCPGGKPFDLVAEYQRRQQPQAPSRGR